MKNKYKVRGSVTAIYLTSKKYGNLRTFIDTKDLYIAASISGTWFASYDKRTKCFYVHQTVKDGVKRTKIQLHRYLMNCPTGLQIDHINHKTLDNRRSCNLREVTIQQNAQNRMGAQKNSNSGILGVNWNKKFKKWQPNLMVNKKRKYLGMYDTKEEAEKVVKEARKEFFPFSVEANGVSA